MKNLPITLLLCAAVASCGQPEPKQTSQTAVPPAEDTIAQMPGGGPRPQSSTNEQLFRTTLTAFRTAATRILLASASADTLIHLHAVPSFGLYTVLSGHTRA
ncbi:hypothetical protein, partial [Chitinophaga sp.]|uniref:hypothetical protein n=1 Tax=Chitinophaga sp. TaxID=1869181 RepID=UPI00262EDC9B